MSGKESDHRQVNEYLTPSFSVESVQTAFTHQPCSAATSHISVDSVPPSG
ncbi:hypothetical protein BN8_01599 [Fibrisoma limi BUZ 3]|uniref:Uncharacterized protein n=1 Tax=Fibrisoma limi BUZ 3 TaxID=1185876 RepID=I2GFB2_9BACT|nr:hypothetical protein BN8_01599 [Fibrisoma limi BUZ 3]